MLAEAFVRRAVRGVRLRSAVHHARDAEVDELAHAVFDVQTQASERLHQRLDVEAFLRP